MKTPRYRVLVGGSLQINGLLPDDTGMFQCFARNLAGEIQTNTYLAVTSTSKHHLGLSITLSSFITLLPYIHLLPYLLSNVSFYKACDLSAAFTLRKKERLRRVIIPSLRVRDSKNNGCFVGTGKVFIMFTMYLMHSRQLEKDIFDDLVKLRSNDSYIFTFRSSGMFVCTLQFLLL